MKEISIEATDSGFKDVNPRKNQLKFATFADYRDQRAFEEELQANPDKKIRAAMAESRNEFLNGTVLMPPEVVYAPWHETDFAKTMTNPCRSSLNQKAGGIPTDGLRQLLVSAADLKECDEIRVFFKDEVLSGIEVRVSKVGAGVQVDFITENPDIHGIIAQRSAELEHLLLSELNIAALVNATLSLGNGSESKSRWNRRKNYFHSQRKNEPNRGEVK